MKKYVSFLRIRFVTGTQYRMSMLAAITTQLIWGLMECLAYKALWESSSSSFPMDYAAVVSYFWLQEAFLAIFNVFGADKDIFSLIMNGGIAYEMCRPVSIYSMWFVRNLGGRLSDVFLRCMPVLIGAVLMPKPFRLGAPKSLSAFFLFLLTLGLAAGITIAFCTFVYMLCFFTLSPNGWKRLFTGAIPLLSGAVIPLPFIPQPFRGIMELLPFACMQNVPLRIYSGDLSGQDITKSILLQIFWLAALIALGSLACNKAQKKVIVQGG